MYLPYEPQEYKNNNYKNLPQETQNNILTFFNSFNFSYTRKLEIQKSLSKVNVYVEEISGEWVFMTPELAAIENDYYIQCAD